MKLPLKVAGPVLAAIISISSAIAAGADRPPAVPSSTGPKTGIDPATPLAGRVTAPPPDVLKMFADDGLLDVRAHTLTPEEQRQLAAAFEILPPLHRKILRERLVGISFVEGMPNTALTSTDKADGPDPSFHITVRAGIFRENASEWATRKERSCFDASGSPLSVSVEAGGMDSIAYVLLHEATHVVDAALKITPDRSSRELPSGEVSPTEFTRGIWTEVAIPSPPYRDPLLQSTIFHADGKVLPISQAGPLYAFLRQTPFASLYGSHAWTDDLAEYVALYHWTQILGQPYRVTIRDEGRVIFDYEPMKSELVRRRFDQMKRFYD